MLQTLVLINQRGDRILIDNTWGKYYQSDLDLELVT